jgi:hypothetical protein
MRTLLKLLGGLLLGAGISVCVCCRHEAPAPRPPKPPKPPKPRPHREEPAIDGELKVVANSPATRHPSPATRCCPGIAEGL